MIRFVSFILVLAITAPALAGAPSYADKKSGRVAYSAQNAPADPTGGTSSPAVPAYSAQSSVTAIEPAAGMDSVDAQATAPSSRSADRNRLPRKD